MAWVQVSSVSIGEECPSSSATHFTLLPAASAML
jgi:hypothetical protein